jgi:Ca2+-binding RTX toxin-like protein
VSGAGKRFALSLTAVCLLGLVFASALEALRPLCGGRRAMIASNDRTIYGTRGPDVIVGGRGPNTIHGAGGNDVICGGHGRDRIYGGRGKDTIDGKTDADLVHGGRGSDEIDGGADRDRVFGDSGNDTARGGPGDRDEVDGGLGDDDVQGGRGNFDTVFGGIGRDRVDGGPGAHDVATFRSAGGAVVVNLEQGSVSGAEAEQLSGVEDVVGGSGDDLLTTSDSAANRLDGGPGDDRLLGSLQQDQAFGGPGDDECFGSFAVVESCGASAGVGARIELYESLNGSSSLAIAGEDGADNLAVSFQRGRYLVSGGSGDPIRLGDPRYASGCGFEGALVACAAGSVSSILVSLGPGSDTIAFEPSIPSEVSLLVDGGPGSDWLRGGPGEDTLYSGDDADPDQLQGGGGDDALFGVNILHPRHPSGAATLLGGGGDDLMVGGQPCDGDFLDGGAGDTDSASFSRVRNEGIFVEATIGGPIVDPDEPACAAGRISHGTEKIEGSTGPDVLLGGDRDETLLGRGGADLLDGRGGEDRCIGGRDEDRSRHCEYVR